MCYFWVYIKHRSCLYYSAKTAYFGKISLKLYLKMLLANQIARFFKFSYHKNCLRYKVPSLDVVKCSWKLQLGHVIFFGFSQVKHAPSVLKKISNKDFEERFGPSMWFFALNDTPLLRIYINFMAVKNLVHEF